MGLNEREDCPYTPTSVVAFKTRHREVAISWLPSGHDFPNTCPEELAETISRFADSCPQSVGPPGDRPST